MKRRNRVCAWLLAFAAAGAAVPGCGSSALKIHSEQATVEPQFVTAVYRAADANTADIYLSDIPEGALVERLSRGAAGEPGNIVHVHLFLRPKAGRTPIDFDASNMTLTHVVLTGSAMGIYGGGGFMLPSWRLGADTFGGRIKRATLRLVESDPGFSDRLGPSTLSGRVTARKDDELAGQISDRLTMLLGK